MAPAQIELREITRDSWEECIHLQVAEDQQGFVAPNVHSLAMAAYEPDLYPRGVYNAEGAMVGFIMYGYWAEQKAWWIARVMTDARYQGHGYGKAAILQVADIVKNEHAAAEIGLSYVGGNDNAAGLYESLGFKATGETLGDEIVMRKPLTD